MGRCGDGEEFVRFEWNTPAAWNSVEGVSRPNLLHVVGNSVSLGAISGESALERIHGLSLEPLVQRCV